jgi:fido (protein-threonine AMPylation protein)
MIYFSNKTNNRNLTNKAHKGILIKIYQGIYVEKKEDIILYLELIFDYLNIQGIVFYKSALELLHPSKMKELFIISTTINKKIVLKAGDYNFAINVLKISNQNILGNIELQTFKDTQLKIPKLYYAILINFKDSKVFKKRSNKNLACQILIEEILSQFHDIKHAKIYFGNLEVSAEKFDLMHEFIALKYYFTKYYTENFLDFDRKRIELFQNTQEQLLICESVLYEVAPKVILFYEAYFSNYIEGTEFEIDEAQNIIFNPKHRYERHKDGHDIINTYTIVNEFYENPIVFKDFNHFIEVLKDTHYQLMVHRKEEITVGDFKTKVNVAGQTQFVLPSQIHKTLEEAYKIYAQIENPLHKAIYMHLMLVEVHPFDDGNGRISRMFMNNELSLANKMRIVIPTVFREDYISALKAFSQQNNPKPIVSALIKAYKITKSIDWSSNMNSITQYIKENSGFEKGLNSIWGVKPDSNDKGNITSNGEELPFTL